MALGLETLGPEATLLTQLGVDRRLASALEDTARLLESFRQAGAGIGRLSQEGGESVVRSLLLDLLTAGLGSVDPLLGSLVGRLLSPVSLQDIAQEIAYWTGITAFHTGGLIEALGLSLSPEALKTDAATRARQLAEGKAVANGKSPTRNPSRTGDPVVLHRGEFEREVVDLEVGGAGIDLQFRRTYRSAAFYLGPLGPGWDHNFNLRLREENPHVAVRLTGQLGEHRFVRHPRFGEADYSYFAPPDGVHDVLVPDGAGSFELRRPQGTRYVYEATDQPGEHRVRRIEDRFGNYLGFAYTEDDFLHRIEINSPHRFVRLAYDETGRLSGLEDHAGRVVRYDYDDWGYLASVTGPNWPGDAAERREGYEYDPVGGSRCMTGVLDWLGRPVVENEYDTSPLSDSFGCITRQTQNRGESTFFYERVPVSADPTVPRRDVPVMRVWECRRNGHQIVRQLNSDGNELTTRERVVEDCRIRERVSSRRFNADGQIVARIGPEGEVSQYLYGREQAADAAGVEDWPDFVAVLDDVPIRDRMAFGNLMAEVSRGRRVSVGAVGEAGGWDDAVPRIKTRDHPDDRVIKYRYTPELQLLWTVSDPRHTLSPDPLHVESAQPGEVGYDPADPRYRDHQRHLTRHEYGAGPRFEPTRTVFPDRTYPSPLGGVGAVTGIAETYPSHDAKGRLLALIDVAGFEWLNEYYPVSPDPAAGAREGFLRRRLVPHNDLLLGATAPDVLEIRRLGAWQALPDAYRSGGRAGDALELAVEGVRVVIETSSSPNRGPGANDRVGVSVDGHPLAPWDQTAAARYIIDGLPTGAHTVRVEDAAGIPVWVGRVRTHVAQEFEVDALGRLTQETDGRGDGTAYLLDARGLRRRVTRGTGPNRSVVDCEYDGAGRPTGERAEWRDEVGRPRAESAVVTARTFDPGGLLLSFASGPEQGGPARLTTRRYDCEDRLWEVRDSGGTRTYFAHDEINRLTQVVRAACTPDASTVTTEYDLESRTLVQINPRGAVKRNGYLDAGGNWLTGIDPLGRVRVQTDPLGHCVVTDHDAADHPTVVRQFQRRPDGRFELLSRTRTDFDEHGDVIRTAVGVFPSPILSADPVGAPDAEFNVALARGTVQEAVTETFLDARGKAVATRAPDGGLSHGRYDGQGRLCDESDATGARTVRVFDGSGNSVRLYQFDPIRDPATGDVLRYEAFLRTSTFDELGREIWRSDPYGNRWRQFYDSLGNRTRADDPLGNVVRFTHNAFGEEIARSEARTDTGLGGGVALAPLVTQRIRDDKGNVILLTDPAGRQTVYVFDALDRLVRTAFGTGPNAPTERRVYDPAGNLVSLTMCSGLILRSRYDLADRRRTITADPSGMPAGEPLAALSPTAERFRYDGVGRLVRHTNKYCVVTICRDSRGLAWQERVTARRIAGVPAAVTISRRFDIAGKRDRLVYPSGREVSYGYDDTGRVKSVRNTAAPAGYPGKAGNGVGLEIVRREYAGGRLTAATLGNGLLSVLRYDGCGRVIDRAVLRPDGTTLWRLQRLRDAAGFTRVETATTRPGDRRREFSFDSVYRLVSYRDVASVWVDPVPLAPPTTPVEPALAAGQRALDAAIGPLAVPPGPQVFEYDLGGNRVSTREPGLPASRPVPNDLNQYATVDRIPWQYDADGQLRSDGTCAFAYDLRGALQVVTDLATGRQRVAYYRDAIGRVIAQVTPAGTVFRVYDDHLPITESGPAGPVEYTPDHLAGQTIHVATGGDDYWVTRDGPGSLRLLTAYDRSAVAVPTYRPFGAPEDRELALSPVPLGFGGMWFTPGLVFYHSRSRTFRADVGRYLQRDPAGTTDGPNLYTYVGNSPLDRWDPTGLEGEPDEVPDEQQAPNSPYRLTEPGELQLSAPLRFLSEPGLTDFQKELIWQEFEGRRGGITSAKWGIGRMTTLDLVAPILQPKLPPPGLVYSSLAFMLVGPLQIAGFIEAPLATFLQAKFSEAVGYGTYRGLVAAGASERSAHWGSIAVEVLSGAAFGAGLRVISRLAQSDAYVYQIVAIRDGEPVIIQYGVSGDPANRIRYYVSKLGDEFVAMQIRSGPLPRPQALAAETWLTEEGLAQGYPLLNKRLITLAEMKGGALFYGAVETPYSSIVPPYVSLLNPEIYRR
jgi:RHS repeat-associated protein